MSLETSQLSSMDIGVLVSYFVLVILVGVFAMWRANRGTVSGYFLAGRSMWFLPIGASLFVSNIGTEHFIGLSGSGAASGISVGAWELNALLLLQLLGWIFIPVYIACGTYTMPEYLSKRFGGQRLRIYFACLSLVLYVLTKCSGDLYTGALFIQQSLKWDLYVSIVILIMLTAMLTITGGLTAVIYTDTLQAVLMLGGALYLMVRAFEEVGGFQGLLDKYPQAVPNNVSAIVVNTTCHWTDPQAFRMLRDVDDDYMPWLGFLLGQTPGSIWYWCTDQVIVQRVLAAKSLAHAQGATLMAGVIKIMPIFIMVIPGMISRVLYPNEVACTNPDYCMQVCQSRAGCSNIAYPRLVLGVMPEGARGLMMAVMIAALMSDLDSIFNSASTLFTMDVWRKFRKSATTTELMVVGRLFIIVMVGVSIAWVPIIKETSGGQVFIYINEVTNYLAPPFAALFLLALLVPRVNEKGAFWSLMLALVIGLFRLVLKFIYQGQGYCGSDSMEVPPILSKFHYMYFALFTTVFTATIALVISYLTEPPDPKFLVQTTYWSRNKPSPLMDTDLEMSSPSDEAEVGMMKDEKGLNQEVIVEQPSEKLQETTSLGAEETGACAKEQEAYTLGSTSENDDSDRENERASRIKEILFNLICGVQLHKDMDAIEHHCSMKRHLQGMNVTEQTMTVKVILAAGMMTVVGIGVAMYIFWSVYPFDTAPFYPEGAAFILPGDGVMKNVSLWQD
ncbi:sodium/myo-inositol cotransporter-like [Babylonia areolata]|uniref:sodium/myo-inositol cotransporter-like n=1 Tax=Babylonia areolata TaxID=304850 RepID=UPI003FD0F2D9